MENPVFKLEKVLHAKSEELQDFEGPLDLILYLLSRNKIEIQDISVSLICDQYMEYLRLREQMDLNIASEFITMASHLVYLKTKMLLAAGEEETKEEVDSLIQSLEERQRKDIYQHIRFAAETLAPMSEFGRNIFLRSPEVRTPGKVYVYSHETGDLLRAVSEMTLRRDKVLPPLENVFREIAHQEPYPVETKARDILVILKNKTTIQFLQLFRGSHSRSELVATFLAILELCRARILNFTEKSPEEPPEEADPENHGEYKENDRQEEEFAEFNFTIAEELPVDFHESI